MKEEIDALYRNHTWSLVDLPNSKNLVICCRVYKIKRRAYEVLKHRKARLFPTSFNQIEGIDFGEIYKPVIKSSTIKTIISIEVSHGWLLRQLDVDNAFLNDNLHEEVYMS